MLLRKTGRQIGTDFAVCLSLANLVFLSFWGEVQDTMPVLGRYLRGGPPDPTFAAATAINTFGLGLFGFVFCRMLRLWPRTSLVRTAKAGLLLVLAFLVTPADLIRLGAPSMSSFIVAVGQAVLLLGAVFVLIGDERAFRGTRTFLLIAAPLFPIVAGVSAFQHLQASRVSYAIEPHPTAVAVAVPPSPGRVVWIIFDELDASIGFTNRPARVKMRAFDALTSQAVSLEQALPPATRTLLSMPRWLSGPRNWSIETRRRGPDFTTLPTNWALPPNLFTEAAILGARSAVVGFYHPYCEVFGTALADCSNVPLIDATDSLRAEHYCRTLGLAGACLHVADRRLQQIAEGIGLTSYRRPDERELRTARGNQLAGFLQLRRDAIRFASDASLSLVLIHLPVPHPFGIYDADADVHSLAVTRNYVDNLELADRTLADLKHAMEGAGLWQASAVIVCSDHGLRPEIWSRFPTWTPEEAGLTQKVELGRVPFFVKLPGQVSPATYPHAVDSLFAHDLVLDLLAGTVRSVSDATNRLDSWRLAKR